MRKHFTLTAFVALLACAMASPAFALAIQKKQPEKISLTNYTKRVSLANWPKRKSLTDKKRVLGSMVGGRFAPVRKAPATTVQTFEAALLYSDSWTDYYMPYGVATFQNESPVTFKQVFENEDCPQVGGGFFTDKYY